MNERYEQERQHRRRGANKTYAYYTKDNALLLKPVVDSMIEDGKPRAFSARNCSAESLKLKIHRGILYLIDNLDDPETHRYYRWRNTVKITQKPDMIIIQQKADLTAPIHGATTLDDVYTPPEKVEVESINWRDPLETFIEEADAGTVFQATELNLSDADLLFVKSTLAGLGSVIHTEKLTKREIHLKRIL